MNQAHQEHLIELTNVSRWYGNLVAVNDVSFTAGAGISGLLGPNGAGKSTILHMISGFLHPSAGTVTVAGLPAQDHRALYEITGIVPEREAVYPFLTGYEFVLMNAKLHKLADPVAATRRALQAVGMEFAEGRTCGGYSKGMKQRIKVAAAIVHDPRVLLLDEPFNGMDPGQRVHLMGLLRDMAAEGRTIVFSSHILDEVERLADQVLVIAAGRLAASGDFRKIRRLMTDRPHTFRISSSDDRALAKALIELPVVKAVELDGDRLDVRTSNLAEFIVAMPKAAQEHGVRVRELTPTDESLESVFLYLVNQ